MSAGYGLHDHPRRLAPLQGREVLLRAVFILGSLAGLWLLRAVDPVAMGGWLPFHTSCGAITGLPCLFCGMTRALHWLFNGELGRAFYFNWLAFPCTAAIAFLIALFLLEILFRRRIFNLNALAPTPQRLTIIMTAAISLWIFQAYLAVSQHKHELLNPRGALYAVFVK